MNRLSIFLFCTLLCILPSYAQDAQNSTAIPKFKHILIFVLENQDFWMCNLNNHLSALAKKGTLLTDYRAETHPSQPNYIAMFSGDTMGVGSDSNHDIEGTNIVDLLEAKGISWKSYQEEYPEDKGCFSGGSHGRYRRKHNPFMSYNNVRNNATLCANIVNSDQLWKDLDAGALPQFVYYTPDMFNNGHDTGIVVGASWAYKFINKLLAYPEIQDETLIVLTYDEGLYIGKNNIFTLLIGPNVPAGRMDNTRYTHYSLLRTIEDNYELGTLGRNDDDAVPFQYANKPPGFLITVGALIGIVIAGVAVLVTVTIVSVVYIRRAWRRRVAMRHEELQE